MKRGFTLLELIIVLTILSLLLTILLPIIVRSGLNSEEAFKTELSSLFSSSFVPGKTLEFCVDFKRNEVRVGEESVRFPYEIKALILPGKIVSAELTSKYCIDLRGLTYGAFVTKEKDTYPSILFTFPTGEVFFYNLSKAEAETLKDKVGKGRIVEWFNYYSF